MTSWIKYNGNMKERILPQTLHICFFSWLGDYVHPWSTCMHTSQLQVLQLMCSTPLFGRLYAELSHVDWTSWRSHAMVHHQIINFFQMHEVGNSKEPVYKTKDLYATDRVIFFFFSDVPHLIKTTRNCWSNSFSHKNSRALRVSTYIMLWCSIDYVYSLCYYHALYIIERWQTH